MFGNCSLPMQDFSRMLIINKKLKYGYLSMYEYVTALYLAYYGCPENDKALLIY